MHQSVRHFITGPTIIKRFIGADRICLGLDVDFRHHVEYAVLLKQTIRQKYVNMWMPTGIISKGPESRKLAYLDGHDRPKSAGFQTSRLPEETEHTLIDTLTEFAKEFAVVLEKGTKNNRNAENILTVRYRIKEIVAQVRTELYHLFRVTAGADKRPQGDSGTNGPGMRRLKGIVGTTADD